MKRIVLLAAVLMVSCIDFTRRVTDVCATSGACVCAEPGTCCVNAGFTCDDTSGCCSGARCVMGTCVGRATGGGAATGGGTAMGGGSASDAGPTDAGPGEWVYEAWWMESVPLEGDAGFFAQVKRAPFDPDAVHVDDGRAQVVFSSDGGATFCPPGFALTCGSFRAKGSRTSADVALGVLIATADNSPPNLAMVVGADGGLSQQLALTRAQCGTSTGLGGVDLLDGQLAVSCGNLFALGGVVSPTTTGTSSRLSYDVSCAAGGCVVPWQTDLNVTFHRTTFQASGSPAIIDFPGMVMADDRPTPATAVVALDDGGVFAAWSVFSRNIGGSNGVWVETPGDGGLTTFDVTPVGVRLSCLDSCVLSWGNGYSPELRSFEGGQWVNRSAGFMGIGVLSWAGVLHGTTLVVAEPRLSGNSELWTNGTRRQTVSNARQLTIVRHR